MVATRRVRHQPEPEYFHEKRDLEDVWEHVFLFGVDIDELDMLLQHKWSFTNLETALGEDGVLHNRNVYLFGFVEKHMISIQGQEKLMTIPVVVAVVLPFPPSDQIVVKPSSRVPDEIEPMKKMRMDWFPYIPLAKRKSPLKSLGDCKIFTLNYAGRRAGHRHLNPELVKKLKCGFPYIYNPLQEPEQRTVVTILFKYPKWPLIRISCEFDWEVDNLEEFTNRYVDFEDARDSFKAFVEEKVEAAKQANFEAIESHGRDLEELSEETRVIFENMRLYKFYPDTPDVPHKSPFIGGYFGLAHHVL